MLINRQFISNKQVNQLLQHVVYLAIVLVLIPAYLYFELCVVLPTLVEEWSLEYLVHMCSATFLLQNIIGNMIYGMFTNTSIRGISLESVNKENWTLCGVCECMRPPRAWHCNTCNICILKRDHHCTFLASCVGYFNHRYFIMFTFYLFISMMYAFYYNVKFLSLFISWNRGLIIIKFLFPLASFALDYGEETVYVFLVDLNVIVGALTGFLFFYHFNNILQGRVVHEATKNQLIQSNGWKSNLIEVFGARWFLAWISPFITSQLPGNGMEWSVDNKYK